MYKVLAFIQKLVLINVTEQNYVFTCKYILREITDKTGKNEMEYIFTETINCVEKERVVSMLSIPYVTNVCFSENETKLYSRWRKACICLFMDGFDTMYGYFHEAISVSSACCSPPPPKKNNPLTRTKKKNTLKIN